MSFRLRLTLLTAIAVAVGIAIASLVVYVTARAELLGQVDSDLHARAAALSAIFPGRHEELSIKQRLELVNQVAAQRPDEPAAIVQVNSPRLTLLSQGPGSRRLPAVSASLVEREGAVIRELSIDGARYRGLAAPFRGGVVQVARPLAGVERELDQLRFVLLLVSLGGAVGAALLGALVSRAAVAPLRRLLATTDRIIETGDLTARTSQSGRDEVGHLASRFDTMLDTLDTAVRSQRQLVADASHELRTPLASLRANLELLVDPGAVAADERDELVRDVRDELEAVTSLVTELLELARGEEFDVAPRDFRLDETVRNAVSRVERRDPEVTFDVQLEPSVVRGVPERVERAVANLLDNACKWSPDGAVIDVAVRDGTVAVRDRGPGIAPEDRERVFDRFYRAQTARAMPGAGLGLAIVKQIADAHGGQVSLEEAPGGGTIARLQLSLRR
jgi:two-component system, OmpR family, sensor histidine kinase MprB